MEDYSNKDKKDIFSQAVRAGKRTYFFDVKETRNGEFYLTLTESKKQFPEDRKPYFEKHKIFLYKEDFEKFSDAFKASLDFIEEKQPYTPNEDYNNTKDFTKVDFEDLDN